MTTLGSHFGPYEVVAPLGAGGMGEVYRARDSRLGRDVAIKVLPPAFANDADRLARFEREARTLAALNHPNIAAIYGVEDSRGVRALVMELVEGEALADRLRRGRIATADAVSMARAIADAIEAAHARGIIHRDLKPANIKITPAGAVKVLDFGLAKAVLRDLEASESNATATMAHDATRDRCSTMTSQRASLLPPPLTVRSCTATRRLTATSGSSCGPTAPATSSGV
jgi:serine/threonine protein kinase